MKRSKHSLSHYKLSTFDMGELIPVGWYEVLPGDTVQQATSALVRVSPLLAPVMHPVSVRIHHWFVPNRLIWEDWEDFITGGPDGEDATVPPYIDYSNVDLTANKGFLLDHLGIPPMNYTGVTGFHVSALPARAYALIFNEFYRDEDLVTEAALSLASGQDSTTSGAVVRKIAWEKDYFTSARPWPQKGPDITLPLGTTAPVVGIGKRTQVFDAGGATRYETTGATTYPFEQDISVAAADNEVFVRGSAANGLPEIFADLSEASAVNVNLVRRAFALQRYQEARAQYGSRYTEYLRYLGVRSSDARLQRPEYLGGGKQTIAFSEVLRTGGGIADFDTDEGPIGDMKGHGIAAMRSRRYQRFFEEHGIVMSLMSVRPRTMYAQGLHRGFLRTTKEDYWQRELELIGQQEINTREIYAPQASGVFAFQDRYSDYRHIQSSIAGDFRDTLDHWHMARIFGSAPALNATFVTCDPTKRINAVQDEDVLWCMIGHSIQARRMVTKRTIGRIM